MLQCLQCDVDSAMTEECQRLRAALVGLLRVTPLHGHWRPGSACSECAAIAAAVEALGLEVVGDGQMYGFVLPTKG